MPNTVLGGIKSLLLIKTLDWAMYKRKHMTCSLQTQHLLCCSFLNNHSEILAIYEDSRKCKWLFSDTSHIEDYCLKSENSEPTIWRQCSQHSTTMRRLLPKDRRSKAYHMKIVPSASHTLKKLHRRRQRWSTPLWSSSTLTSCKRKTSSAWSKCNPATTLQNFCKSLFLYINSKDCNWDCDVTL